MKLIHKANDRRNRKLHTHRTTRSRGRARQIERLPAPSISPVFIPRRRLSRNQDSDPPSGYGSHNTFSCNLNRSLLTIGVPLTASTLVLIARYRLFAVLIGGTAGAAMLGQVHVAFRLVDTVRELTFTALWRLMLPVLSEYQHDRRAMLAQVDRWLRWCAVVVFPLCLLLAIGLTQVVALLMGPNWAATGQAAAWPEALGIILKGAAPLSL